jgi:Tol biopolymer transport system component
MRFLGSLLFLTLATMSLAAITAIADQKLTAIENSYPFWSPDGGRIVFHSNRSGNRDLYVINADGSGLTRLTDNPAGDGTPAWSPDGARIVFQSDRDGNDEIYVMRSDGSQPVNLTRNLASDSHPYWSPDGTRIIFNSNRDDGENDEVYTMKADGTDLRRLTRNDIWDTYASWSPDGRKIAFRRRLKEPGVGSDGKPIPLNSEIFVMDADGSHAVNLTRNPAFDGYPAWTPDGRIVFASNRSGAFQILTMDAQGGDLRVVVPNPGDEVTHPQWSRTGKLVFTREREGSVDLWVKDAGPPVH